MAVILAPQRMASSFDLTFACSSPVGLCGQSRECDSSSDSSSITLSHPLKKKRHPKHDKSQHQQWKLDVSSATVRPALAI